MTVNKWTIDNTRKSVYYLWMDQAQSPVVLIRSIWILGLDL